MLKSFTNLESDRFGFKTILHIIIGLFIYFLGQFLAEELFNFLLSFTTIEPFTLIDISTPPIVLVVMSLFRLVIPLLLIYLYITKILKMSLCDFRICRPKNIGIWILCAIALPLAVSCFYLLLTSGTFVAHELSKQHILFLFIYGIFYPCIVAGISEEFLFRGFFLRLLEVRWGKYIAIVVPSVLFGILHIFNMTSPNIIDILVLLVAGTSVGIMFSLIAYQSGSIWSSAVVHGIWNLIIIGGILEIGIKPELAIFTYTLKSNSVILTGGAFGIESSLPAIVGYCLVILLAWLLQRRMPVEGKVGLDNIEIDAKEETNN